jgi:2-dehydropantoate 2-reductase
MQMHVLIFGAGALGQALGCMLAADGHDVSLVLRRRFIEAIEGNGLRVSGIFGDYEVEPGRIRLLEDLNQTDGGDFDAAIITTKSYDTPAAIDAIDAMPNFAGRVVSMQNGCGNIEQVQERFGADRTFGARVITGFEITATGKVAITVTADAVHIGSCHRGRIPAFAEELAAAIDRAGLPCIAVEDIYQDLFAKLLYNCSLNPLGAILGVHYGALGERPETRRIMDAVMDETFAVIRELGGNTPWPDADAYRQVFYEKLLPATYNHRPSMLQDLENGKPTEVESLVGYVAGEGKKLSIPTPTCALLADLVRFREATASAPKKTTKNK